MTTLGLHPRDLHGKPVKGQARPAQEDSALPGPEEEEETALVFQSQRLIAQIVQPASKAVQ